MKSKKICLLILILTLTIITIFPVISIGSSEGDRDAFDMIDDAFENINNTLEDSKVPSEPAIYDGPINTNYYKPNELKKNDVQGLGVYGGKIAGFIRIIGTIASVGTLMIIGIRFMLGSAEEKAEYKDRMYPYIIGAVLLFAASNLVDIIYGLAKNM